MFLLLIIEKQEENKYYNTITWTKCDLQGNIIIKNNSSKEKIVNIRYELKTKSGMEVVENKNIKIDANTDKKINVYQICDAEREDVLNLGVSIEEYIFLLNIQSYLVACFIIISIFTLILYFYINILEKRKSN